MHTAFTLDATTNTALCQEGEEWFAAPAVPVRGILDAYELGAPYSGPYASREAAIEAVRA